MNNKIFSIMQKNNPNGSSNGNGRKYYSREQPHDRSKVNLSTQMISKERFSLPNINYYQDNNHENNKVEKIRQEAENKILSDGKYTVGLEQSNQFINELIAQNGAKTSMISSRDNDHPDLIKNSKIQDFKSSPKHNNNLNLNKFNKTKSSTKKSSIASLASTRLESSRGLPQYLFRSAEMNENKEGMNYSQKPSSSMVDLLHDDQNKLLPKLPGIIKQSFNFDENRHKSSIKFENPFKSHEVSPMKLSGEINQKEVNDNIFKSKDNNIENTKYDQINEIFAEFKDFMQTRKGPSHHFENYVVDRFDNLKIHKLLYDSENNKVINQLDKKKKKEYYNKWYIPVKYWSVPKNQNLNNNLENLKELRHDEAYLYNHLHDNIKKSKPGYFNQINPNDPIRIKHEELQEKLKESSIAMQFKE